MPLTLSLQLGEREITISLMDSSGGHQVSTLVIRWGWGGGTLFLGNCAMKRIYVVLVLKL